MASIFDTEQIFDDFIIITNKLKYFVTNYCIYNCYPYRMYVNKRNFQFKFENIDIINHMDWKNILIKIDMSFRNRCIEIRLVSKFSKRDLDNHGSLLLRESYEPYTLNSIDNSINIKDIL